MGRGTGSYCFCGDRQMKNKTMRNTLYVRKGKSYRRIGYICPNCKDIEWCNDYT